MKNVKQNFVKFRFFLQNFMEKHGISRNNFHEKLYSPLDYASNSFQYRIPVWLEINGWNFNGWMGTHSTMEISRVPQGNYDL